MKLNDAGAALKFGIAALTLLGAGAAGYAASGPWGDIRLAHTDAYHGVRLGLPMIQVQGSFHAIGGRWSFEGTAARGSLEWTRTEPGPDRPTFVSFQIHNGVVQAIRAELEPGDPLAAGPVLETSLFSILARERADHARVVLTLLARGCSDQTSEVMRLLALQR